MLFLLPPSYWVQVSDGRRELGLLGKSRGVSLFARWCGFTATSTHTAGLVFRVDGRSQTGPVRLKESRSMTPCPFYPPPLQKSNIKASFDLVAMLCGKDLLVVDKFKCSF